MRNGLFMVKGKGEVVWIALSVALLAGAGADRFSLRSPTDPGPYQAHVREVAAQTPMAFGHWVGQNLEVPPEAKAQLHPNVILSRRYHNTYDGHYVDLLLVQCWDVRDLIPHYPPICYPGRGLSQASLPQPMDWPVGNLTVTGTEYQFEAISFQTDKLTIVDNFMILPDGRTCREMTEVRREVALNTRFFGAAQVQFVFESDVSTQEREKICIEFIKAYQPLIDAIGSGVRK